MNVILDYGMGNSQSLKAMIEHLGYSITISSDPETVVKARRLFIPGVGHFQDAVERINVLQLIEPVRYIIAQGHLVFGICLGMQLLLRASEESEGCAGLAIIDGSAVSFDDLPDAEQRLPHTGFNQVKIVTNNSLLLAGLCDDTDFYFNHNYLYQVNKKITTGLADNGQVFSACIESENVLGAQFHPELSQQNGMKVIKNIFNVT